jgi:hypothetical protein
LTTCCSPTGSSAEANLDDDLLVLDAEFVLVDFFLVRYAGAASSIL